MDEKENSFGDVQIKDILKTDDYIMGVAAGDLQGTQDLVYVVPGDNEMNRNVCIIGPAGSGKTWCYILPNILQAAKRKESILVADICQGIYSQTAKYLEKQGYEIKFIDVSDTEGKIDYTLPARQLCAYFFEKSLTCPPDSKVKPVISACIDTLINASDDPRIPVNIFIDSLPEFPLIDDLHIKLETLEEKQLRFSFTLQSVQQLQDLYPDTWCEIMENCDTMLCLGVSDTETLDYCEMKIKATNPDLTKASRRGRRKNGEVSRKHRYPEFTCLSKDSVFVLCKDNILSLHKYPFGRHPDYEKLYI